MGWIIFTFTYLWVKFGEPDRLDPTIVIINKLVLITVVFSVHFLLKKNMHIEQFDMEDHEKKNLEFLIADSPFAFIKFEKTADLK